jgi:hypothetical protein
VLETDAGYLRLITEAAVPGAVAAVIRNGAIDRYVRAGTSGAYSAVAVDEKRSLRQPL